MDRKDFFSTAFQFLVKKSSSAIVKSKSFERIDQAVQQLENSFKIKEMPPGACPDPVLFQELCTGCDACMAACPVNVIMIEDLEKRHPLIYPEENPCIKCSGFPCIASCPTGALSEKFLRLNN